jgi:WD40 repeat protein
MWDITGQHRKTLEHQSDVNKVVFSGDGNFVTCCDDGKAIIWDQEGNRLQILNHNSPVKAVAFSPDGKRVVTGGSDNTAKLWDLNGNLLANYKGHGSGINSVAFSPNDQYLVTASTDRTAKLWSITNRQSKEFSSLYYD